MGQRNFLNDYVYSLSLIMRLLDMATIAFAGVLAFRYYFGYFDVSYPYRVAIIVGMLLTPMVFSMTNVYAFLRGRSFPAYLLTLFHSTVVLTLILCCMAFFTHLAGHYSRLWFGVWLTLFFGLLVFSRIVLLSTLTFLRTSGLNENRVCIIGAGDLGQEIAQRFQQETWSGFRAVMFFDDSTLLDKTILGIPVKKLDENIAKWVQGADVREVWVALPLSAEARIHEVLHYLRHSTVTVRLVPNLLGERLLRQKIVEVVGFPVMNLNISPMGGFNRLIKELEDRVLAAVLLILVSPLLALIALGIKCTSPGPILFKQLRHGGGGRLINVYKFRTMVVHQEQDGHVSQAVMNDARVTRFGCFLRRTSLDELPQLFNVLQGRMSIVGPRPHAVAHNEHYKELIDAYMQRHKVKPGITGWAQVNGWRGETETVEKMEKRIEYDLYYIEHWSLLFDIKIIMLTLLKGFVNKNAY